MVEKIIGFFYIIFMREETTIEVKDYIKQVFPELEPLKLNGCDEYIIDVHYTDAKDDFSMIRVYDYQVQIGEGFKIENNMLKPAESDWPSTPIYKDDEDLPKIKQLIDQMKKQYVKFKIYLKKQEIEKDFKNNVNKKLQNSV